MPIKKSGLTSLTNLLELLIRAPYKNIQYRLLLNHHECNTTCEYVVTGEKESSNKHHLVYAVSINFQLLTALHHSSCSGW